MIKLCRFRPEPARMAEFISGLWEGDLPPDLVLHRWLYVDVEPREMVLLWEGGADAEKWVEQAFGAFGTLTSESVTDSTPGLAACLDRDLDGFGAWLHTRGTPDSEVAAQLDLRRRGLQAQTREEALAAGRQWAAERASG